MVFNLPADIKDHIIQHALTTPELEVCGLLASRNSKVVSTYRIENIADDPGSNFFMQPEGQIAALKMMRQSNEQLCAIYHSHPRSEAIPSVKDIENAAYKGTAYLIISLMKEAPEILAYYYSGDEFQPMELSMT